MKAEITKKKNWSIIWIFPVIALAIGLYLAYQRLNAIGPTITITFSNAEGLEAKKTKIRYKDLDIGTVSDITLAKDLKTVEVTAQMTKSAEPLLHKDSKFWIVKPQITAAGITGLNTLLSGSFIILEPGVSKETSEEYTALETPPLTSSSAPGVRVTLTSESIKGLNVGSHVYYRGISVGYIEQIKFDKGFQNINIDAFIKAPYNQLINNDTKFWNASGFDLRFGPQGPSFMMQSLETLVLGGINFNNLEEPTISNNKFDKNKIFTLYPDEADITKPDYFYKQYYLAYFDNSVDGLAQGAPVVFQGIQIGKVTSVRLMYDETNKKIVVPVLIEVTPQLISTINNNTNLDNDAYRELIPELVADGLHATLATGNVITGGKQIVLKNFPELPGQLQKDKFSQYSILPTQSGNDIGQIATNVGEIVSKINSLPLTELVGNFNKTAAALSDAVSQPSVKNLGNNLQKTLVQFQEVGSNANKSLVVINKELKDSLHTINPNSSLYYEVTQTLDQLQKTAKSINQVMDMLNKKPNALIMGK